MHPPAEGLSEIHKEMGGGGDVGSWTTKLYRDVHFARVQTPKAIPGRSFFMDFSLRPVGMCLISSLLSTFFRAAPPKRFPNCFISLHYLADFALHGSSRCVWVLVFRLGLPPTTILSAARLGLDIDAHAWDTLWTE